jgi:ATP-dependent Clp protease ATP-binding subunit ClpB
LKTASRRCSKRWKKPKARVILFIDELHTLVGAGASEGSMDASNMLKPALARGTLRCVGATTLNEYRKYIEKDAALERRFPAGAGARTQCGGHRFHPARAEGKIRGSPRRAHQGFGHRGRRHPVDRYIADRFLPDKAIDLIDECASKLRIEIDSMPVEIDEIQRKILQAEIERQALKKESDPASQERLAKLEDDPGDHAFPDCRHENPLGR